jgi:hypothetical protein
VSLIFVAKACGAEVPTLGRIGALEVTKPKHVLHTRSRFRARFADHVRAIDAALENRWQFANAGICGIYRAHVLVLGQQFTIVDRQTRSSAAAITWLETKNGSRLIFIHALDGTKARWRNVARVPNVGKRWSEDLSARQVHTLELRALVSQPFQYMIR